MHAFAKSARKLGVEQIDLLLLHQPVPERFETTIDAYLALEQLHADGLVRALGVSNFMPEHLRQLRDRSSVVPAVNQIELHPYFTQPAVRAVDSSQGTVTQAWSPIGGITHYWGKRDGLPGDIFADATLQRIAEHHQRSVGQVMLRWHLQQGRAAVPKSTRRERIAENFVIFDVELTEQELRAIDGLDTGVRGGPDPNVTPPERFETTIPEAE